MTMSNFIASDEQSFQRFQEFLASERDKQSEIDREWTEKKWEIDTDRINKKYPSKMTRKDWAKRKADFERTTHMTLKEALEKKTDNKSKDPLKKK